MAVCNKLIQVLNDSNVKYQVMSHSKAYTSQERAATMHVAGKELAKSVIVKDNGSYYMVVLPSSFKINFDMLKDALENKSIRLASEKDFKSIFADCEVGAMCPFGQLYDMPVYVAKSISDQDEIVFTGGTHTDAVRIPMNDYMKLANPTVMQISEPIWPKK